MAAKGRDEARQQPDGDFIGRILQDVHGNRAELPVVPIYGVVACFGRLILHGLARPRETRCTTCDRGARHAELGEARERLADTNPLEVVARIARVLAP